MSRTYKDKYACYYSVYRGILYLKAQGDFFFFSLENAYKKVLSLWGFAGNFE